VLSDDPYCPVSELSPHRQTPLSFFEKYELELATVVDRDTVADREEIIPLRRRVLRTTKIEAPHPGAPFHQACHNQCRQGSVRIS
jgi:hypothetical protein